VHRDPEQSQRADAGGHAVGVDRLVHHAPSVDQSGVQMADKMKHNTQSSGSAAVCDVI